MISDVLSISYLISPPQTQTQPKPNQQKMSTASTKLPQATDKGRDPQQLKLDGNAAFNKFDFEAAAEVYTQGLMNCPATTNHRNGGWSKIASKDSVPDKCQTSGISTFYYGEIMQLDAIWSHHILSYNWVDCSQGPEIQEV